jgi:hypothetical protein
MNQKGFQDGIKKIMQELDDEEPVFRDSDHMQHLKVLEL